MKDECNICQNKGRTQIESVREQVVEENIWK
jgi:hypothetical protein